MRGDERSVLFVAQRPLRALVSWVTGSQLLNLVTNFRSCLLFLHCFFVFLLLAIVNVARVKRLKGTPPLQSFPLYLLFFLFFPSPSVFNYFFLTFPLRFRPFFHLQHIGRPKARWGLVYGSF